jgi:hypothetical protein
MKLRIKGNSMRLRVSRSELARLLEGERVEETIHFSAAPDSYLTYGLQSAAQPAAIRIQWEPRNVTVLLSDERLRFWGRDAEVGIYESLDLGPSGSLEVIIEKDFACLDRSDEENNDTFANPSTEAVCR